MSVNKNDVPVVNKDGILYCSPCELEYKDCEKFDKPFDVDFQFRENELKKLLRIENFLKIKDLLSLVIDNKKDFHQFIKDYKSGNANLLADNLQMLMKSKHGNMLPIAKNGKIHEIYTEGAKNVQM